MPLATISDSMRCPTLKDLPPPPGGRVGWPWTEESRSLADTIPDGRPWPKISVVTPSYNQGQFIEETIRSVLLQRYPNLEYIIIDGGSVDKSIDIIRKYQKWITYFVSEPDKGPSHAANKGFKVATGDICGWINSDDTYLPNVLGEVAVDLDKEKKRYLIFGDAYVTDEKSNVTGVRKSKYTNRNDFIKLWTWKYMICPQALFFYRNLFDELGFLDETLIHPGDHELLIRFNRKYDFHYIGKILGTCRVHASSRSSMVKNSKWLEECKFINRRYWGSKFSPRFYYLWCSYRRYKLNENSKRLYVLAEKYFKKGEKTRYTKFAFLSIFLYPLNLFNRNHLSLLARAIFGREVICRLKNWIGVRRRQKMSSR